MFIPDPRWEEPNLLIPGKKPTGPMVIDWSHPLARGLDFYALGEDDLESAPLRIPSSLGPITTNTGTALAVSSGGRGRRFDLFSDKYTWASGQSLFDVQDFTLVVDAVLDDVLPSGTGTSKHYLWNNGTRADLYTTTGSIVQWEHYDGSFRSLASSSTFSDGDRVTIVVVRRAGVGTELYINGVFENSDSNTGNIIYAASRTTGWGKDVFFNSSCYATILSTAWYGRSVSKAEATELSRNPYCFLIPA